MNKTKLTLMESINYIDEYLTEAENIYYNNRYAELFEMAMNGYLDEKLTIEEAVECISEINTLFGVEQMFESEEDFNAFLKEHDYDPKSKTIKFDDKRRVRIDTRENIAHQHDKRSKYSSNDTINDRFGGSPFGVMISGRVKKKDDTNTVIKKDAGADITSSQKIDGIGYSQSAIKNLNKSDIDYLMNHEYGHINDFSDHRATVREIDLFNKYNYNMVPKSLRAEFLKWKQIIATKKKQNIALSNTEAAAYHTFMDKLLKSSNNKNVPADARALSYTKQQDRINTAINKTPTIKTNPEYRNTDPKYRYMLDKDYRNTYDEVNADAYVMKHSKSDPKTALTNAAKEGLKSGNKESSNITLSNIVNGQIKPRLAASKKYTN